MAIRLYDRSKRPAGAVIGRLRLRSFISLFLLAFLVVVPNLGRTASPSGLTEVSGQDIVIEARDGLITATFNDRTDDSVLRAALPDLVAKGVQSINLHGSPVSDSVLLAGIPGLIALDLGGTQVRNLAPLQSLASLQVLNLQFLRINDLRPLATLTGLRTLNLGGTEVSDLTPLAGIADLRNLVLSVTKVKDLTPLAALVQLRSLDLSSTRVWDIRSLARLTRLQLLNLNGAPVDDIEPLAGLTELRTLDLGGTRIADVQALVALRELRSLNIESTQVADIAPLARLPYLHSIASGGSLVRTMEPPNRVAAAPAAPSSPPEQDVVLVWNDQVNRAIQTTWTDAFVASRALAIESIAILDTLKSIDGAGAFLVRLPAPRGISANIAAAAAGHTVLSHLFPSQRAMFDRTLATALMREPAGPVRDQAVAFGKSIAEAVIMVRDEDGSMVPAADRDEADSGASQSRDGAWRPVPPDMRPAAHPEWATLQTFLLTRPEQFRPAGPPAIDTDAYRQSRAEVASLGAVASATRTAEQTEIAHYWSDAIGSYAPAGHWNAIAAHIVAPLGLGLAVEAELFAELNVAIADAGIAMADAKYTYRMWRPITAIQVGDDARSANPEWQSLLKTPNYPAYISGHSAFSGAAAVVLTAWFGARPFTFSSASLPGVTRHFANFDQAAAEAGVSRIFGGIHFPFDIVDGQTTGREVGAWTMAGFGRVGEDRGPIIMMMSGMMPMPGMDAHKRMGCVLDNVAPVGSVSVALDNGEAPFSVAVDEQGTFALPQARPGMSQPHSAILSATSITGRKSEIRVSLD